MRDNAGGSDAGRAFVYHGGPPLDATPDLILTGAAPSDNFGISVQAAGDVNGDGFGDLIVGARYNDAAGVDAGRAYIHYGAPAADALYDVVLSGIAPGDEFGGSVAPAGDVNGDGFVDLVVGAVQNDAAGADAGAAWLFDFSRYVVLSPNDDEVWNVGATRSVSWLGAEKTGPEPASAPI